MNPPNSAISSRSDPKVELCLGGQIPVTKPTWVGRKQKAEIPEKKKKREKETKKGDFHWPRGVGPGWTCPTCASSCRGGTACARSHRSHRGMERAGGWRSGWTYRWRWRWAAANPSWGAGGRGAERSVCFLNEFSSPPDSKFLWILSFSSSELSASPPPNSQLLLFPVLSFSSSWFQISPPPDSQLLPILNLFSKFVTPPNSQLLLFQTPNFFSSKSPASPPLHSKLLPLLILNSSPNSKLPQVFDFSTSTFSVSPLPNFRPLPLQISPFSTSKFPTTHSNFRFLLLWIPNLSKFSTSSLSGPKFLHLPIPKLSSTFQTFHPLFLSLSRKFQTSFSNSNPPLQILNFFKFSISPSNSNSPLRVLKLLLKFYISSSNSKFPSQLLHISTPPLQILNSFTSWISPFEF